MFNRLLKDKKGRMLLKDIIFMMVVFFSIIAFANIFVSEMGTSYSNTNMTSSYSQSSLGEDNLTYTSEKWEEIALKFVKEEGESGTGYLWDLLTGGLESIGIVLVEVVKAPHTFASMVVSIIDLIPGVDDAIGDILVLLIDGILYSLIIFMIVKAFLKGGEL